MTSLGEIIKRLEAATGPDRSLDTAVMQAIGYEAKDVLGERPGRFEQLTGYLCRKPGDAHWTPTPHVTRSIDAALTLVPDGWAWQVGPFNFKRISWAQLAEPADDIQGYGPGIKNRAQADHVVPAISLCIAALKARQAARILASDGG